MNEALSGLSAVLNVVSSYYLDSTTMFNIDLQGGSGPGRTMSLLPASIGLRAGDAICRLPRSLNGAISGRSSNLSGGF